MVDQGSNEASAQVQNPSIISRTVGPTKNIAASAVDVASHTLGIEGGKSIAGSEDIEGITNPVVRAVAKAVVFPVGSFLEMMSPILMHDVVHPDRRQSEIAQIAGSSIDILSKTALSFGSIYAGFAGNPEVAVAALAGIPLENAIIQAAYRLGDTQQVKKFKARLASAWAAFKEEPQLSQ